MKRLKNEKSNNNRCACIFAYVQRKVAVSQESEIITSATQLTFTALANRTAPAPTPAIEYKVAGWMPANATTAVVLVSLLMFPTWSECNVENEHLHTGTEKLFRAEPLNLQNRKYLESRETNQYRSQSVRVARFATRQQRRDGAPPGRPFAR